MPQLKVVVHTGRGPTNKAFALGEQLNFLGEFLGANGLRGLQRIAERRLFHQDERIVAQWLACLKATAHRAA